MNLDKRLLGLLLALGFAASGRAAPFDKTFAFAQPDGTVVEIHGRGDEFHAVFETTEGYAVVFSPGDKSYYYAAQADDGRDLVPSPLRVGQGDPATLGIPRHLRADPVLTRDRAAKRREKWEAGTRTGERWKNRKSALQAATARATGATSIDAPALEGPALAPPAYETTGTKVGLCLLIDFSDDPATIARTNIVDFCNGDAYAGFGNNGSVKQYYQDVSDGLLTYTNIVTAYIRMTQPKSYYNDTSKDCGEQGILLIKDAIAILKALPNYATEIAPQFAALTADGSGNAVACNVFYAGGNGGVWNFGLWPHSWALNDGFYYTPEPLTDDIAVLNYQITNIGDALELGTFCHENGHMLCDYPDLYDYDYDSRGAGLYCLMAFGSLGANPVQPCAYLKRASGWATTLELTGTSTLTASLSASGAGFNTFYRFAKPGTPTEYYLVENRQKTGRDAFLPASGIAIWLIDELGDHDNQSLAYNTTHANYEVTLMQADGLWHLQSYQNYGDAQDLFFSGNAASSYQNAFSNFTIPDARWWDGTYSGINWSAFSANAATMTFAVNPVALSVISSSPLPEGAFGVSYSQSLEAVGGSSPYTWSLTGGALPPGLFLFGDTLMGTPSATGTYTFEVQVEDAAQLTATRSLSLVIQPAVAIPLLEAFETGGVRPAGWTERFQAGAASWTFPASGDYGFPAAAHGGSRFATLFFESYTPSQTRLITPCLDLGLDRSLLELRFWHYMKGWYWNGVTDQDELRVFWKGSGQTEWTLLATYATNTPSWTQRTIALPTNSRYAQIAFEGTAKYGFGVCIDDVIVARMTPRMRWDSTHFSADQIVDGQAANGEDPDADAIPNLLEYAWALDPLAASASGKPGGGVLGDYLTLTYRQNKQATDLDFAAEACADLESATWTTNAISEIARADSNAWWQVTERHDVPVSQAPSRFMRLRVEDQQ